MMKKLLFFLFVFPVLAIGQSDFDTQYFTIEATPSPEIKSLELVPYKMFGEKKEFGNISLSKYTLAPIRFSTNTHWQAVDMVEASNKDNNFIDSNSVENSPFTAQLNNQFAQPGLQGVNKFKVYNDDEFSPVENSVYKDQRMPYFGNPYNGNPSYYNPYRRQSNVTLYKNKGTKNTISIHVGEY